LCSFVEIMGLFCGICGSLLHNTYLVSRGDGVKGTRLAVAVEEVESSALLWDILVSFVGYEGLFCGICTWDPEATVSEAIGWLLW